MNAHQHIPEVKEADFQTQVLKSALPVLVDFFTSWSRPCGLLEEVLCEVSEACSPALKVVKVNADDSLDLSLLYDIQSVPTLLYFVNGEPLMRIIGTATKEAILAKLHWHEGSHELDPHSLCFLAPPSNSEKT